METDWLLSTPIAHRGLHGPDRPENSLAAFTAAIDHGYAIELDVRALGDGALVVLHDSDTMRMTGLPGAVSALTRASLRDYRLRGTALSIPLFSDVLELVAGRVPILVEIKSEARDGRIEAALAALLDGYGGPFAVQSFNPHSMNWFRRHRPRFPRGLLSGRFADRPDMHGLKKVVLRNLLTFPLIRPQFIAYEFGALGPLRLRLFKAIFRVPIVFWTIKSRAEWEAALHTGANAIFEGFLPP